MKTRKCICLLIILCLSLTMFSAMGETENMPEFVTEKEFVMLLEKTFPELSQAADISGDDILTSKRALAITCEVLGYGEQSDVQNLAFAIENNLIIGITNLGDHHFSIEDANRLIEGLKVYLITQLEQNRTQKATALAPLSMGIVVKQQDEAAAITEGADRYMPNQVPSIDYNSLNDESYGNETENRFLNPLDNPFSTFALDVDTASYSNIRRCLVGGYLPDKGAIRIEEMLNYFDYDFPVTTKDNPISITSELNVCPWNKDHLLAMIALKGFEPEKKDLPGSNLVFLVDVSGSMEAYNRLPLARQALKMLVSQLNEKDRVTIVTYTGSAGVLLETTPADMKEKIIKAIDSMSAQGSTNGAGGINAAYEMARKAYIDNGNNRVILLTDGDFNVGVHSASELEQLIVKESKDGIYLSVLGFGMGNLKDYEMETLADYGNGNYAYIDTLKEAKKVLVDNMTSTIFTIANDVKLQVEFNPEKVTAYRLIGYENRLLETEDFTDDKKDAGEIGAGQQMIALYEIIPSETSQTNSAIDGSRYQQRTIIGGEEIMYVSVRYKPLEKTESNEIGNALTANKPFQSMSTNMGFASAVAEFGLILSESSYKENASLQNVIDYAVLNLGKDSFGYRSEFVQLVELLRLLK